MCSSQHLSWSPPRFSLCIWVLLCWEHICLQYLCLLGGFFLWVLWSDLLRLSLWPFFLKSVFSDMSTAIPAFFSCPFVWKICFQAFIFSLCSLLSWGGSLLDSMYVGHVFLYIQLFYVFWLEHLIHLRLRLLFIGIYLLPILCTCVPLSFSFPSFP